jgi:sugar/nucleoside kinase (ribokinase family)
MARYDIYGIGAALVDTEVEVSDKFLADAKIDKGVMTLVDEARQRQLLEALSSEDLTLLKKCGGSVCNSVVAASSLGSKVFFSGKVADDADGELYVSDLNRAGVDFHSAGQDPGTTGKCLVMVTEDAERTMNTFLGASETLSSKEIDRQALKDSDWFYVEGYLVTDEARTKATKEAVEFAKEHGVKIAISLSDPFVVDVFGDALRDVMGSGVDLVFCNKDEALAFTGTDNLDSAIEKLKMITKSFAITDGANGAITFDGELVSRSEGVSAKTIDTNGAGDMFAGAFLYAITSGRSYDWAAKLANDCASRVVAKFGPRLESEDFDKIKAKFRL